jgi:hypothetical protein
MRSNRASARSVLAQGMTCDGTPSAKTHVEFASVIFREREEVPMTIVGGFDVHRQQITFDYVDNEGLVHWG